jgi:Putative DNA-binding domain
VVFTIQLESRRVSHGTSVPRELACDRCNVGWGGAGNHDVQRCLGFFLEQLAKLRSESGDVRFLHYEVGSVAGCRLTREEKAPADVEVECAAGAESSQLLWGALALTESSSHIRGMPLRTMPLGEITQADAQSLIDRQIRENRTLDFKRGLRLDTDQQKKELLKDITAMANAAGGTLLYGAVEGDGDDRGMIVGLEPMPLIPDDLDLRVSQLLRDCVDQPLAGVQTRAIPCTGGGFLYVIRVQASARAPHSFRLGKVQHHLYARGTVSNDPMTMTQVKDLAMRAASAVDRAMAVVEHRTVVARRLDERRAPNRGSSLPHLPTLARGVLLLHVLPLGTEIADGGPDFANISVFMRLRDVLPPLLVDSDPRDERMGLDGLSMESTLRDAMGSSAHALLLRGGGIEFSRVGLFEPRSARTGEPVTLDSGELERSVIASLREAERLARDGLLGSPVLVSLRILDTLGARLTTRTRLDVDLSNRSTAEAELLVPPVVLTEWGTSADHAARRLFDVVWQAFGLQRCFSYGADGQRRRDA